MRDGEQALGARRQLKTSGNRLPGGIDASCAPEKSQVASATLPFQEVAVRALLVEDDEMIGRSLSLGA